MRVACHRLLEPLSVLPYFFFSPRLDLRDDRKTVAGRGHGEEGAVASLFYFEVTFLGDRKRLRFCPVGLHRNLDHLWFSRLFRNHLCSHFIVLLGLSSRTKFVSPLSSFLCWNSRTGEVSLSGPFSII